MKLKGITGENILEVYWNELFFFAVLTMKPCKKTLIAVKG